jgi:hypothetical protein
MNSQMICPGIYLMPLHVVKGDFVGDYLSVFWNESISSGQNIYFYHRWAQRISQDPHSLHQAQVLHSCV